MGRRSREKGARGEREVVVLLRPVFPSVRRRCAGEESQCRRGRDLDGTPGFSVQVQLSGAPTIERKLREAVSGAEPGERPVAFTRRSRIGGGDEWLATLLAQDLVALMVSSIGKGGSA